MKLAYNFDSSIDLIESLKFQLLDMEQEIFQIYSKAKNLPCHLNLFNNSEIDQASKLKEIFSSVLKSIDILADREVDQFDFYKKLMNEILSKIELKEIQMMEYEEQLRITNEINNMKISNVVKESDKTIKEILNLHKEKMEVFLI